MGTLIGYCTNFLAVKMMFRPKNEIRIRGRRLPFTPGVIPKQKNRLAAAIGNAVGTSLLTKEDIKSRLMGDELKNAVTGKAEELLSAEIKEEIMHLAKLDSEGYDKMKGKLSGTVTKQLTESIKRSDVGSLVSEETTKALMEKVSGSMLKYLVTEEMVRSFTDHMGKKVEEYIDENGEKLLSAELEKRMAAIESSTVTELLEKVDITHEKLSKTISDAYGKAVDKTVDELLSRLDISKMIREKIEQMDADKMEELTLKVMKDQLDVIINLGALIGFLLSLVNVGIDILSK